MQTRRIRSLAPLLALALLAGCSSHVPMSPPAKPESSGIGPYAELDGRLIVIEPGRRWQVLLHWQASVPDQGSLRLTHAASQSVIELRWANGQMWLRSTSERWWRPVRMPELGDQGIVLAPWELAELLLGGLPSRFVPARAKNGERGQIWETREHRPFIRLQWNADRRTLKMTDITHGRMATLIIMHAG